MQSNSESQLEFIDLPRFPKTLFAFKQYDGFKTIAVFLLILATIYLLTGFWGFLLDHNAWLHNWIYPPQPAAAEPSSPWWNPLGLFHKNSIANVLTSAISYIDMAFRVFIFLCSFCFAWSIFDPRNIEGYAMGFFNMCLGVAYVIAPIDFIPDSVPLAGSVDDTFLGVGMAILGVSGCYRTHMRNDKAQVVKELINHGNTERALQILLEDKGISVKSHR